MENSQERHQKRLEAPLEAIHELLQRLVAVQLWKAGATKEHIAKRLRIAKATVVAMLKGLSKD